MQNKLVAVRLGLLLCLLSGQSALAADDSGLLIARAEPQAAKETIETHPVGMAALSPDASGSGIIPVSPDTLEPRPLGMAASLQDDAQKDGDLKLRATSGDLWERIRIGFALPELDTPLVAQHEQWYANRPDYVKRMAERSQRYLFHILEEVEKRGMPTEVALLPMIESAFNPRAYSRAHASGIWQFIPATGKTYGLEQNWWFDGRRDIMAATDAALDYLEKLHGLFGDWQLALAAYNWGEGAVQRAQAKNRAKGLPTDYLSLKMPNETRHYLPKLVAIKNIIMKPAAFDIELPYAPNQPYFTAIALPKKMDVKVAAKLAEMPVDEFLSLNPGYNRPVMVSKGERSLLLPVDKAEAFSENLENHDGPLVSWQTYMPKKGEGLDAIARKFGISTVRLREINGINGRKRGLPPSLLVPIHGDDKQDNLLTVNFNIPAEIPSTASSGGKGAVHRVRKGDTLASLARRYDISQDQIKAWNSLKSTSLRPGQKLVVAQAARAKPGKVSMKGNASRTYMVRKGDTLGGIAKRFKVAATDIQRWNNLSGKRPLQPGITLTLITQKNG